MIARLRAGESGPLALSTCVGAVAGAMSGTMTGNELQPVSRTAHPSNSLRKELYRHPAIVLRRGSPSVRAST